MECYWYYEKDDDDMLKVGEEISRIIRMPFKFVEVEDISIIFPSEI